MREADVTLTDFLLTIQCWTFAVLLTLSYSASIEGRFIIGIFFFVGAAALTGGIVHGWSDRIKSSNLINLWRMTLLAVVFNSAMMWLLVGQVLGLFVPFAFLALVLFLAHAWAVYQQPRFYVAIISYVPAVLAMLLAFFFEWQAREIGAEWVCLGLLVSLAAPVVQVLKISIHPKYLTFNAFYHLIQFVGFFMLFFGLNEWLQMTTGLI